MLYLSDINPPPLKTNNPCQQYYQKSSLNIIKENIRSLKELKGKKKIKKAKSFRTTKAKDFFFLSEFVKENWSLS